MKRMNKDLFGAAGSIPPQLLPFVDRNNMTAQTQEFIDFMEGLARDYHNRVSISDFYDRDVVRDIKLTAPSRLFGQDVKLKYIGHGTMGAVYKMEIGGHAFALKINRMPSRADMAAFNIHKYVRNLANRPYIGSSFTDGVATYSWIVSDYVADDKADDFERAKEKLFYAIMTKGILYHDLNTNGNVKGGKIIDLAGLQRDVPDLSRAQIDMVKKFMYLMRSDDMAGFKRLADAAMKNHPAVIKYMFLRMAIYGMEMPSRFAKFKQVINEYNNTLRLNTMSKSR